VRSAGLASPPTPLDRLAMLVATAAGAGYAPVAPGTVGSALACVVLWAVPFSRAGLVAFLLAVILVGTWAAERTEQRLAVKDPGAIVIDEVAGMTLAVLAFPRTVPVLAAGFVLFRILDVVKPFPANVAQRPRGGVGVMLDDLVAGAYALGALAVSRALLRWP
jgi:phosphatidylglycerophosphatase A